MLCRAWLIALLVLRQLRKRVRYQSQAWKCHETALVQQCTQYPLSPKDHRRTESCSACPFPYSSFSKLTPGPPGPQRGLLLWTAFAVFALEVPSTPVQNPDRATQWPCFLWGRKTPVLCRTRDAHRTSSLSSSLKTTPARAAGFLLFWAPLGPSWRPLPPFLLSGSSEG